MTKENFYYGKGVGNGYYKNSLENEKNLYLIKTHSMVIKLVT